MTVTHQGHVTDIFTFVDFHGFTPWIRTSRCRIARWIAGFLPAPAGKATDRITTSHQNLECYHSQIGRLKEVGTCWAPAGRRSREVPTGFDTGNPISFPPRTFRGPNKNQENMIYEDAPLL